MNRPWQIWLAFGACALVVMAAMGWLTLHTLRVDRQLSAARAEARLEQNINLALWRMDTKLAPLIAEEVARPPSFYEQQERDETQQADLQSELARLSASLPSFVLLNFSCDLQGNWHSPQVPDEVFKPIAISAGISAQKIQVQETLLEKLSQQVEVREIVAQLPRELLPDVQRQAKQTANALYAANQAAAEPSSSKQQKDFSQDLQQRNLRYQDVAQQELRKQRASTPSGQSQLEGISEGVSRPIWVGDNLLLARRLILNGNVVVQGSWLNWPNLRSELLAETVDLVPEAELAPVRNVAASNAGRMLAGLPVQIVAAPASSLVGASSPIRWALRIGWGALLLAAAAVAALLAGVIALSERRAAFVSSVTHELRSPLTTFRMYSDMLARGMVSNAQQRQAYMETLRREAERLTHLVENVLSYARLERGRGLSSVEQVAVGELVERLRPRLAERAELAQMQLEVTVAENTAHAALQTDVSVVEQILFNLVDNAAKYAVGAVDCRIHWQTDVVSDCIRFTISDHGPGFANARKPQPFSKTSEEAAVTAPGVGLGLALCRRLAKQLGGKLNISATKDGATVALDLPQAHE